MAGSHSKGVLIMRNLESEQAYILNLHSSPYAAELKEEIQITDIEKAEAAVKKALEKISDSDLKFEIDSAIGMISSAYEKLGFIVGYKTHQSGA